jgi:hypothetical protein
LDIDEEISEAVTIAPICNRGIERLPTPQPQSQTLFPAMLSLSEAIQLRILPIVYKEMCSSSQKVNKQASKEEEDDVED